MVIEVNKRLVIGEIAGAYLNFENVNGTKSKSLVGYHPRELRLKKNKCGIEFPSRWSFNKIKKASLQQCIKIIAQFWA